MAAAVDARSGDADDALPGVHLQGVAERLVMNAAMLLYFWILGRVDADRHDLEIAAGPDCEAQAFASLFDRSSAPRPVGFRVVGSPSAPSY